MASHSPHKERREREVRERKEIEILAFRSRRISAMLLDIYYARIVHKRTGLEVGELGGYI